MNEAVTRRHPGFAVPPAALAFDAVYTLSVFTHLEAGMGGVYARVGPRDPLNIVGSWQITAVGYEGITTPIVVTITANASPTNVTATATGGGGYVTGVIVTTEGMPGGRSGRGARRGRTQCSWQVQQVSSSRMERRSLAM